MTDNNFKPGPEVVELGKRGHARMKVIAAENEVQIRKIVAGLLMSLGREPSTSDLIQAEQIAAATVRGRRVRAKGGDDARERRMVASLMKESPFAPRVAESHPAQQAAELSA